MSHPKQSHSVNCHIRNEVPWKIQVKLKSCNKLASFFDFLPQKCTLLYGIHFSFSPQENTEKFKNWCRMGYFHIFGQTSQKFKKYQTTRRAYVCIYLKVIIFGEVNHEIYINTSLFNSFSNFKLKSVFFHEIQFSYDLHLWWIKME